MALGKGGLCPINSRTQAPPPRIFPPRSPSSIRNGVLHRTSQLLMHPALSTIQSTALRARYPNPRIPQGIFSSYRPRLPASPFPLATSQKKNNVTTGFKQAVGSSPPLSLTLEGLRLHLFRFNQLMAPTHLVSSVPVLHWATCTCTYSPMEKTGLSWPKMGKVTWKGTPGSQREAPSLNQGRLPGRGDI